MLHDYMKTLGQELEIPDGILEASDGVWVLSISDEQEVSFTGIDSGAYLFAKVGPKPKKQAEVFLQNIMHANLFGQGTSGGVIGLDDEGENFTFSLIIPNLSSYQNFRNQFEDFLNSLDYWTSEITKQKKEPTKAFF